MLRWKRKKRKERGEMICKFIAGLDTRTKKFCKRDKWAIIIVKS